MRHMTKPFSFGGGEEDLALIRELTCELERAMIAMAANALADFEDSVARQRNLSKRLDELRSASRNTFEGRNERPAATASPSLADDVTVAIASLQSANCQYSMMLKHFSGTARLFSGLYRPYGRTSKVDPYRSRFQCAWSCQL